MQIIAMGGGGFSMEDTPLLDLKPYFASTDSIPDAAVGWHAGRNR